MPHFFEPAPPPLPAGPKPVGKYEYIVIPKSNIKPTFNTMYTTGSPFSDVEMDLVGRCIPGEKRDLIDGSRVYRVDAAYLFYTNSDFFGPYLGFPQKMYRFMITDPTIGIHPVSEWMPVW
jgi:hypothetical protein